MLARVLGGVGRAMIFVGVVVLLFVVYELWGTNIHTAAEQRDLQDEYDQLLAQAPPTTPVPTTAPPVTGPEPTLPAEPVSLPVPAPEEGGVVGRISIPKIGLTPKVIVQGDSLDQLQRGPAHLPGTPLPGQKGNVAIAGHRTTYGAPFHDLDDVGAGDEMIVETAYGTFTYEVTETKIVQPGEVEVAQDKGDNRLTLITCHPKFSAGQRLISFATLKGNPVPKLAGQDEIDDKLLTELPVGEGVTGVSPAIAGASIDKSTTSVIATMVTDLVLRPEGWAVLAVVAAAWALSHLLLRRRKWFVRALPWVAATPAFLVALYFFFEYFATQLPANF